MQERWHNKVAAAVKQGNEPLRRDGFAMLADALALEPDHHDARALQTARQAALDQQRDEEKRLAEIASVRQTIGDLLDRQQFDEAAAAIYQAKAAPGWQGVEGSRAASHPTRAATQVRAQQRWLLHGARPLRPVYRSTGASLLVKLPPSSSSSQSEDGSSARAAVHLQISKSSSILPPQRCRRMPRHRIAVTRGSTHPLPWGRRAPTSHP